MVGEGGWLDSHICISLRHKIHMTSLELNKKASKVNCYKVNIHFLKTLQLKMGHEAKILTNNIRGHVISSVHKYQTQTIRFLTLEQQEI